MIPQEAAIRVLVVDNDAVIAKVRAIMFGAALSFTKLRRRCCIPGSRELDTSA